MLARLVTVLGVLFAAPLPLLGEEPIAVKINVDVGRPMGPLKPIWRFFGCDEPNYAYMTDGRELLAELGKLRPHEVFFRTHNLMTTGDGAPALKWGSTNMYTEDADGRPVYDWTIVDRIFDAYRERKVRPYVQLGFMPKALSTKPDPYQHRWTPKAKYEEIYTGWAYPPKDYHKWSDLVTAWTKHCLERYGEEEVAHWYWQTWNEANIPYWQGAQAEFFKLHDVTVAAVRNAFPKAKVGGPDSAGGGTKWFREFLQHCADTGTPTDFVSFHAKGAPRFVDGHVRMGIANQLRDIDGAFRIVGSFPQFKDKPIVIGESDPDGCAACQGPQLGYRNSTMYSSYTAATFPRILDLADKHGVNIEGALTWAFEFEDQPAFAGFRVLATRGAVPLPVMNVFRMFSKMGGQRLPVTSDGAVPMETLLKDGVRRSSDVSALASADDRHIAILLWHYHDDDLPGPDAAITLTLTGLSPDRQLTRQEFRIDRDHANAFTKWQAMGSPTEPDPQQTAALRRAAELNPIAPATSFDVRDGRTDVRLTLPRQGVSLLLLTRSPRLP